MNMAKDKQGYVDIIDPSIGGEIQYDYDNQAWIVDGVYQDCKHPERMGCRCFGRLNAGKRAPNIH